jgi:hypothetical protein
VIQKSIKMIQHVFLMSLFRISNVVIILIFKNNANQEVLVVLNTLLRAMGLLEVVYSMLNLGFGNPNKNLHIVIYSIKMVFTSYKSSIDCYGFISI